MQLPPDTLDDLNELTIKIRDLIESYIGHGCHGSIAAVALFKCLFALSTAKGMSKKSFLDTCAQSWDLCEALLKVKEGKRKENDLE